MSTVADQSFTRDDPITAAGSVQIDIVAELRAIAAEQTVDLKATKAALDSTAGGGRCY